MVRALVGDSTMTRVFAIGRHKLDADQRQSCTADDPRPGSLAPMTAAGGPVTSSFALLRRGPFARLWYAGLLSSFGDWVALFATIALADSIGGVRGVLVPLAAG